MTVSRAAMSNMAEEHDLVALLRRQGILSVLLVSDEGLSILASESDSGPQLALIDTGYLTASEVGRCLKACSDSGVASIVMAPRSRVPSLDPAMTATDFIISPPDPDELVVRARRALGAAGGASDSGGDIISVGDLQIDTSSYEVTIRGERVGLRFKEYELLKLLAENPGRVFSRDALLNQIWGYEYFGGTRTVDVHIRRLRSKIEDSEHNFIETIWNVGYRFREVR